MIISISGRIGSGKDLVGKIIQYLTTWEKAKANGVSPRSFEEWLDSYERRALADALPQFDWEIKKFAGKLKDMVCILLNCTREELEDEEFKGEELGEEWWEYEVTTHNGIGGITTEHYPYIGYDEWGTKEHLEALELHETTVEVVKLTPRLILQLLGTDCVRNIIHPNAWVNATLADYKWDTPHYLTKSGKEKHGSYPNWIITDTRFPNELQAVKDRGGISIRVVRDIMIPQRGLHSGATITHNGIEGRLYYNGVHNPEGMAQFVPFSSKLHPSETALDNAEFDFTIANNGTIAELVEQVRIVLSKAAIIEL